MIAPLRQATLGRCRSGLERWWWVQDKVQAFLPVLDGMVQEGLVTVEKATVIFYRAGEAPAGE